MTSAGFGPPFLDSRPHSSARCVVFETGLGQTGRGIAREWRDVARAVGQRLCECVSVSPAIDRISCYMVEFLVWPLESQDSEDLAPRHFPCSPGWTFPEALPGDPNFQRLQWVAAARMSSHVIAAAIARLPSPRFLPPLSLAVRDLHTRRNFHALIHREPQTNAVSLHGWNHS